MNAILFLGDFFRDARCINMVDSMVNVGKDVVIIDSGNGSETYRNQKIYHIQLPASGIYKYWKFYRESKKILTAVSPHNIIAADLYSLPSAASKSPTNLIYDSREIYTQLAGLKDNPVKQYFWSMIERKFIDKSKIVVVTADSDSKVLRHIYKNIRCITLKNFPSEKNLPTCPVDLYLTLNIPDLSPIFLYQGMLHKGRGIEEVIPLLVHFKDAHYVLLGEGPFKMVLDGLAKKYGVQNRVHFLGSIPYSELMNYTICATIGFSLIEPISESYEHALPNKIFEYAAVGLPIIATNLPEMKNAITKFNLGYCVEFGDEMGLIKAVDNILSTSNNDNFKPNSELLWESQEDSFIDIIDNYA